MAIIGRDALLAGFLPEKVVTLPSGAGDVRVRGLTRWEAVELARRVDAGELTGPEAEVGAIPVGMLEPKLSEDDVREWRRTALAADLQAVAEAISSLSNMDEGAGKGPTSSSRSRRT